MKYITITHIFQFDQNFEFFSIFEPILNKIKIINTGFDFYFWKMAVRSIKNDFTFTTFLLLSCTRVQSWQNGQIDIFEKNQKNKILRWLRCFFFLFMVNSYETNKKISMRLQGAIVAGRKNIKSPKPWFWGRSKWQLFYLIKWVKTHSWLVWPQK